MNFIRFINQNLKGVFLFVIIVICIILVIQLLNSMAREKMQEGSQTLNSTLDEDILEEDTLQIEDTDANRAQDQSIITGENIGSQTANKNQEIIKTFVDYCNDGKINEAYSMISYECRNKVFENIDEFQRKYIEPIFSTKKDYNLKNWISTNIGETYIITYVEDILSTGHTSEHIQDYITVLYGEEKINIFRYIDNIKINKSASNNVVTVTVVDKDIYDEYEIYNLKVENNSENTIMINRNEDNDGIYVEYGENSYGAIISDTPLRDLSIEPKKSKEISIKINKMYNDEYIGDRIYFNDIINNKDEFDKIEVTDAYTDISTLDIDL